MSRRSRGFGFAVGWVLLGALPAGAGDGVREINQACAVVGCWPGDTPGLPVRIVETGSYRLTSGLVVDANTTAIEVAADDVSIDLAGFSIRGPATVSVGGGGLYCSAPGSGRGILGQGLGVRTTVRDGSVFGIAGNGAIRLGGGSRVERVSVEMTCGDGIVVGITSMVLDSRSRLALNTAIRVGNASRIDGAIADFSGDGILTGSNCTVSNSIATASVFNPVSGSSGVGIGSLEGTVVSSSSVAWNQADGINSLGGSGYESIVVLDSYMGFNGATGAGVHPASGFGSNVFNSNALGGAPFGQPLQCNALDGVNYCPSHP